jgi:4-amino-4-deoxy-L-arabinose transferase-like glycosyltransferase
LFTAIKLFFLYNGSIPLWVDEAQYWGWSKELAAGYFSKPPLIAWLIHDTTNIFGNSLFGIRVSAPVLHYFTAIFIFLIAAELLDKRTAFYSSIIYITLPAVAISSSFISTDVPLLFFWAAALYFLVAFSKYEGSRSYMLLLAYAVCVGLGLLSKYTMAAFVLISFYYIFLYS